MSSEKSWAAWILLVVVATFLDTVKHCFQNDRTIMSNRAYFACRSDNQLHWPTQWCLEVMCDYMLSSAGSLLYFLLQSTLWVVLLIVWLQKLQMYVFLFYKAAFWLYGVPLSFHQSLWCTGKSFYHKKNVIGAVNNAHWELLQSRLLQIICINRRITYILKDTYKDYIK